MDTQFKLGEPAIAAAQIGRTRYRGPLALTFATSVAVSGGASLLYPVLPVLAGDLGVDQTRIGLVMAAFTAPAVALAPLFGMIADLRGRRFILIFGLALFGLAGSAAALAPSFSWLLTRRTHPGLRGGVISVDRMIQQIAKSLAPTLMGLLLVVAELEAVFWTLCALSIVGTFALAWKDVGVRP